MASRIESDSPSKALRRQAEQNATPPVPAKPPAPGSSPKPIPKRGPEAAEQPEQEQAEDQESRPAGRGLLGQIPAWGISVLLHIVAILVMALMAGETVRVEKPTIITSSVSEAEEEISELEEPEDVSEETPEDVTDPVADVMVTTEVAVSAVEVASVTDDVEAAPLAVDLSEFGSETALASDMMATIGAAGGTGSVGVGGGFGARGKPGKVAGMRGGGADTEAAVDRALKWLAEHQAGDGGWDFNLKNCPNCEGKCSPSGSSVDRVGATALALLPFLGRGYTHREGPYTKQVEGGIRFLVGKAVAGKGDVRGLPGEGTMYSCGAAGIVLSECYALSQDPDLAVPTQAVLNFIMDAQHDNGGWRYYPKEGGDGSAIGWQLMALKSGHMASLQVRPEVIKKVGPYLDTIQLDEQGSGYGYVNKLEQSATAATRAIGLLCRMYLGWPKDHPGLQAGALWIAKQRPTDDLYYDYYATQVMHHLEGDLWIAWNAEMKKRLLPTQARQGHEAGSWYDGVAGDEGHGPKVGGRLYCTAMATMILEVYYRHLPLYSSQSLKE
jgi:hypothetical protein